jgi:hypothetical protein
MIALFVSGVLALFARRQVAESESIVALPDYGFEKLGVFRFRAAGANITGIRILLADYFDTDRRTFTGTFFSSVCLNPESFNGQISPMGAGSLLGWDGTVNGTAIYIPLVLNCHSRSFTIDMSLYNPGSFLDIREAFLPGMYLWLCVMHSLIAVALIFNSLSHLQFRIGAHSGLAASCSLRAISNYMSSGHWSSLVLTDAPSWPSWIWVWALHIASLTSFFTVNGLLLSGWGIYRETITESDWLPLLYITWFFQLARSLASSASVVMWIIFGSIAGVMGACYLEHINEWLIVPATLIKAVGKSDAVARAKLIMVMRFGRSFTSLVFWAVVFVLLKIVLAIWSSITIFVEEMLYFAFTCVDLYFFWIRPAHHGTTEETETVEEISKVTLIDEPGHPVPLLCIVTPVVPADGGAG